MSDLLNDKTIDNILNFIFGKVELNKAATGKTVPLQKKTEVNKTLPQNMSNTNKSPTQSIVDEYMKQKKLSEEKEKMKILKKVK